jgi:hypothetical protein
VPGTEILMGYVYDPILSELMLMYFETGEEL